MAYSATATNTPFSFTGFFKAIGAFFVYIADANSRVAEVEFLNSLTDEELQLRGLRREEILRHVFADRLAF